MRLGLTAPALCPGLLTLGRKDERWVNAGIEKIRRENVTRKEKTTSEEWKWRMRTKRQAADACLTAVHVDPSIFSAQFEAENGKIGR